TYRSCRGPWATLSIAFPAPSPNFGARAAGACFADRRARSRVPTGRLLRVLVVAVLTAACSSPTWPGTSAAAAAPLSPANGASIPFYKQPITLTATNGVATGGAAVAATFDVATDAAFAKVVSTISGQAGADGHVTATLAPLGAATDYYWRVRTAADGATAL